MLTLPDTTNIAIHIVGCGGTGGFTFTNLARLFAGSNTPIILYDGDIVEPKNLKRQQFTKANIDMNKAEALVQNAKADILDLSPVEVRNHYITDVDDFIADILVYTPEDATPVIVSAVDNVATRKLINEALSQLPIDYIAIDSGNNNEGGQVVVTSSQPASLQESAFSDPQLVQLMNMFDVYPELATIEDTNPGLHRSCDEVVESEPQAMMANSRNADIISNIVLAVHNHSPIAGNVFESNLNDFTTKVKTCCH